ncbi:MAG: EAL domain-containing protein [Helicobacteraceae bacterium]|nr:EAL domain-containing protein [Helicobacteraceae bacterium]
MLKFSKITKSIFLFTLIVLFVWSAIVSALVYNNILIEKEITNKTLVNIARSSFNKDLAYRKWASSHGGVYVTPTAKTPPSPWMAHIEDRDIVTTDGKKLTLMNPAYMLREMMQDYSKLYGIKGRIVGKVYLNENNKANAWESAAIDSFDKGSKESMEIITEDGKEYLKLMQPMIMSQECQKCHGHLNFKNGSVRGGVSVSVPTKKFKEYEATTIEHMLYTYFTIWLLGTISIFIMSSTISYHLKRRENDVQKISSTNITLVNTTKELSDNLAFYKSFQKATDKGNLVSKSDLKGNITYVNDNFCNVTGYNREELIGNPHNIIRHSDTPRETFKDLWRTIQSKNTWKGTLKNRKKNGDYYWVEITVSPILSDSNEIIEYVAIRHDITELVKKRIEIEKSAQTDKLTGVGNRFKLINDIDNNTTQTLALMLINIDTFSEINDFYGHHYGDLVISELATRLTNCIGSENIEKLYRLHGDVFAILNDLGDTNACSKIANTIINDVSSADFKAENEEIPLQVTIAITSEQNRLNLLPTADMAMKIARKEQKNLVIYDESMTLDKEYANNIKWSKILKDAIKDDRLTPFYQPIVNNATGKFEKYESLVRLIEKDGKVISPYFFLDIAKRTKNYISLTKIVISKSFEMFKDKDVEFSINLTIQDIMNEDLQEFLFTKLEEYKIAKRVVLEIVESEGIENFDKVLKFIHNVKDRGCKVAIDDFGTGYSNFEYLIQLKADYIKIDGSMIKNLDTDSDARAVVSTIVEFAKKMHIKTIAEFVKDEKIAAIVKEMHIDYSQGYYYGEPKAELKLEKQ